MIFGLLAPRYQTLLRQTDLQLLGDSLLVSNHQSRADDSCAPEALKFYMTRFTRTSSPCV